MKIAYASLEKALAALERSVHYLHSDLARAEPELREEFQAATIQGFQFTYETAIEMIRLQLSRIVSNPDELQWIDFDELMRDAASAGLIRDLAAYIEYRELRSNTPYPYDAQLAENTVAGMDRFICDIRLLLEQLRERNRETD